MVGFEVICLTYGCPSRTHNRTIRTKFRIVLDRFAESPATKAVDGIAAGFEDAPLSSRHDECLTLPFLTPRRTRLSSCAVLVDLYGAVATPIGEAAAQRRR